MCDVQVGDTVQFDESEVVGQGVIVGLSCSGYVSSNNLWSVRITKRITGSYNWGHSDESRAENLAGELYWNVYTKHITEIIETKFVQPELD